MGRENRGWGIKKIYTWNFVFHCFDERYGIFAFSLFLGCGQHCFFVFFWPRALLKSIMKDLLRKSQTPGIHCLPRRSAAGPTAADHRGPHRQAAFCCTRQVRGTTKKKGGAATVSLFKGIQVNLALFFLTINFLRPLFWPLMINIFFPPFLILPLFPFFLVQ